MVSLLRDKAISPAGKPASNWPLIPQAGRSFATAGMSSAGARRRVPLHLIIMHRLVGGSTQGHTSMTPRHAPHAQAVIGPWRGIADTSKLRDTLPTAPPHHGMLDPFPPGLPAAEEPRDLLSPTPSGGHRYPSQAP